MLAFEIADINNAHLIYQWANDPIARENSYHKEPIKYSDHLVWFKEKIKSGSSKFYIFSNEEGQKIGFVRLDFNNVHKNAIISIVVDIKHRGKGYAKQMLETASDEHLKSNIGAAITAYIFKNNVQSYKSFIHAGFVFNSEKIINKVMCCILIKK
jgi:RimJ/RimL family protein N-acetyltransferase